jgi:hypothetical protein
VTTVIIRCQETAVEDTADWRRFSVGSSDTFRFITDDYPSLWIYECGWNLSLPNFYTILEIACKTEKNHEGFVSQLQDRSVTT